MVWVAVVGPAGGPCRRDALRSWNRRQPLNAGRGVTSRGSLLVVRVVAVSSKRSAADTVLLLWMQLLLLLLMVVVVMVMVRSHDSTTCNPIGIPTTVLLVISRPRTRSSPWGLHGHLVGVKGVEEKRGGRGWGLRRRAVGGSGLYKAPSAALAVTIAPESSAPLCAPVLCPLRRLRRPRLVE